MSTDDRIRTATQATAATVREIRPLTLPDDLPGTAPPACPRRRTPGWTGWLIPLSAAVAVIAVAAILVAVRNLPGGRSGPPVPASSSSAPAIDDGVPRYYVILVKGNGAPVSKQPVSLAVVGDDRSGRPLANVTPLPGQVFTGVTAAADDRTFVLSGYDSANRETTFYLLRFTPGAAHPARLTKLPISPLAAQLSGLALSQDGRELAVMFAGSSLQLRTYSVSSGALLGTWHTDTSYWIPRTAGANAFGLSWMADDRHIWFRFDAYSKGSNIDVVAIRTLDLSAPGHDLLADSQLFLQLPLAVTHPVPVEPCFTSLATADGGTAICGAFDFGGKNAPCAAALPPALVSYSAPGWPQKVPNRYLPKDLYRYEGQCLTGVALPLWADSSAQHVIGLVQITQNASGPRYIFGLVTAGHLTSLPPLVGITQAQAILDPGNIAF